MNKDFQLNELAAKQLVRYEVIFQLLDDIQGEIDILLISKKVARQCKYFANIFSWRLIVFKEEGYLMIDGFNGEPTITEIDVLSSWDQYHYERKKPFSTLPETTIALPEPPLHLAHQKTKEINVLPILRGDDWVALFSFASKDAPFSNLDKRFLRLFGRHYAERISAILLQQQTMDMLVIKATRDTLTGLYNRGAIIEQLECHFALTKRTGIPLSVIIADIDMFKDVNDTYGHLAGDTILHDISLRMSKLIRESNYLGRLGGEEFLLVLYPCNNEEAIATAERFRQAISKESFTSKDESYPPLNITISLGISSYDGSGEIDVSTLLRQADSALYQAKNNGRNCVVSFDGYKISE